MLHHGAGGWFQTVNRMGGSISNRFRSKNVAIVALLLIAVLAIFFSIFSGSFRTVKRDQSGSDLAVTAFQQSITNDAFVYKDGWMGRPHSAFLNLITPAIFNRTNHEIVISDIRVIGRLKTLRLVRSFRIDIPRGAYYGVSEGEFPKSFQSSTNLTLIVPPSGSKLPIISQDLAVRTGRPCRYQLVFVYKQLAPASFSISGFMFLYKIQGIEFHEFVPQKVVVARLP